MSQGRQDYVKVARGALVWALPSFVLLQVGLAVATEKWLPQWRDPFYGYKAVRLRQRTVAEANPAPSIVMLGSSRTGFGLQGQPAEEQLARQLGSRLVVYNFGTPGAGPCIELIYLKRLLAAGIRPKLLLLEVLPPLLGGPGPVPMEANWLAGSRLSLRELRLLERHGFPKTVQRADWWQALPLPWYGHRFALVSWLCPPLLPYQLRQDWGRGADDSGWIPLLASNLTPEEYQRNIERARRAYFDWLRDFRLCEPACRAQREILDICRQERIPVALVLMPEATQFQSWYPPAVWAEIETFLNQLSREYAVPIINARNWIRDEDFSDSHHLMRHGAEVFTARLTSEVLLPLLAGQGTALLHRPATPTGDGGASGQRQSDSDDAKGKAGVCRGRDS